MAAKKTTTRASARSEKKKGVLKRINFTSRKVQFVLVILLFGLAGGGFAVYKSFAASASWTYRPEDTASGQGIVGQGCKTATVPEPSKSNAPVIILGCERNQGGGQIVTRGGYIGNWGVNRFYRACALMKGSGYAYVGIAGSAMPSNYKRTGTIQPTADYRSYCSPWLLISHETFITGSVGMTESWKGNTQLAVRSITIEQQ